MTEIEMLRERVKVLEQALSELADLMDDVLAGDYTPDSFTTQPAREALSPSSPTHGQDSNV